MTRARAWGRTLGAVAPVSPPVERWRRVPFRIKIAPWSVFSDLLNLLEGTKKLVFFTSLKKAQIDEQMDHGRLHGAILSICSLIWGAILAQIFHHLLTLVLGLIFHGFLIDVR